MWLGSVVTLSAFTLIGPLIIPKLDTRHFNTKVSFGKGELLGFAFALFVAALSRWIVHEVDRNIPFMIFSIIGMVLVAITLALLWNDMYNVQKGYTKHLHFQASQVVSWSWILVGLSLVVGAFTEILYARKLARKLREPAVRLG